MNLLLAISITFFWLIFLILLGLENLCVPGFELRIRTILKIDQEQKSQTCRQILFQIFKAVQAPKYLEKWISVHHLYRAGLQMDSGLFYSLWWLLILIGFFSFFLIVMISANSIFSFVLACLVLLCSVFLPYLFIIYKIKNREISIRKSFPIFLDLLTLSVDAGLGFFQAVERVNRVQSGVLKQNINDMLKYHQLGFSREETL